MAGYMASSPGTTKLCFNQLPSSIFFLSTTPDPALQEQYFSLRGSSPDTPSALFPTDCLTCGLSRSTYIYPLRWVLKTKAGKVRFPAVPVFSPDTFSFWERFRIYRRVRKVSLSETQTHKLSETKTEKRIATHPTMTEGLHGNEHILKVQIGKTGNNCKQTAKIGDI